MDAKQQQLHHEPSPYLCELRQVCQLENDDKSLLLEKVKNLFDQPQHVACIQMKMDPIEFRSLCKRLGIQRYGVFTFTKKMRC